MNWWCSLKNKFAFGNHSFMHLAALDSWIQCPVDRNVEFFLTSHIDFFVHWTIWRYSSVQKTYGHWTSNIAKCRQSYSNGHLPCHCSLYYLACTLMRCLISYVGGLSMSLLITGLDPIVSKIQPFKNAVKIYKEMYGLLHFFVNFDIFKWLYLAYCWVYLHQT